MSPNGVVYSSLPHLSVSGHLGQLKAECSSTPRQPWEEGTPPPSTDTPCSPAAGKTRGFTREATWLDPGPIASLLCVCRQVTLQTPRASLSSSCSMKCANGYKAPRTWLLGAALHPMPAAVLPAPLLLQRRHHPYRGWHHVDCVSAPTTTFSRGAPVPPVLFPEAFAKQVSSNGSPIGGRTLFKST